MVLALLLAAPALPVVAGLPVGLLALGLLAGQLAQATVLHPVPVSGPLATLLAAVGAAPVLIARRPATDVLVPAALDAAGHLAALVTLSAAGPAALSVLILPVLLAAVLPSTVAGMAALLGAALPVLLAATLAPLALLLSVQVGAVLVALAAVSGLLWPSLLLAVLVQGVVTATPTATALPAAHLALRCLLSLLGALLAVPAGLLVLPVLVLPVLMLPVLMLPVLSLLLATLSPVLLPPLPAVVLAPLVTVPLLSLLAVLAVLAVLSLVLVAGLLVAAELDVAADVAHVPAGFVAAVGTPLVPVLPPASWTPVLLPGLLAPVAVLVGSLCVLPVVSVASTHGNHCVVSGWDAPEGECPAGPGGTSGSRGKGHFHRFPP